MPPGLEGCVSGKRTLAALLRVVHVETLESLEAADTKWTAVGAGEANRLMRGDSCWGKAVCTRRAGGVGSAVNKPRRGLTTPASACISTFLGVGVDETALRSTRGECGVGAARGVAGFLGTGTADWFRVFAVFHLSRKFSRSLLRCLNNGAADSLFSSAASLSELPDESVLLSSLERTRSDAFPAMSFVR